MRLFTLKLDNDIKGIKQRDAYHTMNWHGGQVYVEQEYPNILFAADERQSPCASPARMP